MNNFENLKKNMEIQTIRGIMFLNGGERMRCVMLENYENRVISVIKNLFDAVDVPGSTLASLNSMCQLYEFDRVRSFIRKGGTNEFLPLDDANYGQEPYVYTKESGIDFNRSYYHGVNEEIESLEYQRTQKQIAIDMVHTIEAEQFIHTRDFTQYQSRLEVIGFLPSHGKTVIEACICCVSGRVVGMMGYFVFERFQDRSFLTEEELLEIKYLCEVTKNRIENFETGKQLRDEEEQHIVDQSTGLMTYGRFKEEAEALLIKSRSYAIVYMDIDKFKYINQNWSFETGNEILVKVGAVLGEHLQEQELCTRVIDDKFAALIKGDTFDELESRWKRLIEKLKEMKKKQFPDIKITLICGAYVVGDDSSLNVMLDKANIARRAVKGSYKSTLNLYSPLLHNQSEVEKQLEKKMLKTLHNGEFVPYLQPKFELETNEICGAEALARWETEDRIIAPMEFIPIFEKNGFIVQLDFIIYEGIFQFVRKNLDEGKRMYPISLNVSREHIHNSEFLPEFLERMRFYHIPPELIELEITESAFAKNTDKLRQFISDIREANLAVSIDDFGTAYSSLNMLKDVDVDTIKMDKTFIDNMTSESQPRDIAKDKIIIKNIISMMSELEFKTIFEGVETEQHVNFLKEVGCYIGQGYIFARPMPLKEFEERYLQK